MKVTDCDRATAGRALEALKALLKLADLCPTFDDEDEEFHFAECDLVLSNPWHRFALDDLKAALERAERGMVKA